MHPSEIMTILIAFHMSNYRDFKNFYLGIIGMYHRQDFPELLSYTRFLGKRRLNGNVSENLLAMLIQELKR